MAKAAVLLAVYNAEKYLAECLGAILTQTSQDWELFVCNDGSTDGSLSIIQSFAAQDKRIRVLNNERNMGIVVTRNRLLEAASDVAEYIAWVDADDVCFSQRLELQMRFLDNHPEIGAVGSALEIINENSQTTGYRYYPVTHKEIRKILPYRNVIAQPALMLRNSIIREVGFYTVAYPVCEDYDYWLRVLEKYDFTNFPEPLIKYRISSTQCKQSRLKEMLSLTLKIQRDYYKRIRVPMPIHERIRQFAAKGLLLLPADLILKLFCMLTYCRTEKNI